MITIPRKEIDDFERRYRANFVNSISGYKSANLIATKGKEGNTNLAIFSSVVHVGATPPLLGFVMRPTHVKRHTYLNILETGYYTINALPYEFRDKGHLTSAKFKREVSEFDESGFTPVSSVYDAPYVDESPLGMLCELRSDIPIEINGTHFMVGEVLEVRMDDRYLREDGYFDLQGAGCAAISGLDGYHSCSPPQRYAYARPGEAVKNVS